MNVSIRLNIILVQLAINSRFVEVNQGNRKTGNLNQGGWILKMSKDTDKKLIGLKIVIGKIKLKNKYYYLSLK